MSAVACFFNITLVNLRRCLPYLVLSGAATVAASFPSPRYFKACVRDRPGSAEPHGRHLFSLRLDSIYMMGLILVRLRNASISLARLEQVRSKPVVAARAIHSLLRPFYAF